MPRAQWTRTHATLSVPDLTLSIKSLTLKFTSCWQEHRLTDSDRWAGKAFFWALGDKQRCGAVGWSQPALQEEICKLKWRRGKKGGPHSAGIVIQGQNLSPFQVLLLANTLSLSQQLVPPGYRDLPITSGVSLWGRKDHPGNTKDAISVLHTTARKPSVMFSFYIAA